MSAPSVPHDYVGDQQAPKPRPRTRPNPFFKAAKAIASLRLTVVLFSLAMALVFFGTLGMTQDSIESTVRHYFRCWVAWIDMRGLAEFGKKFFHLDPEFNLAFKVPFPGGYTIGWVMFINLLAAHVTRFKFSWKRIGIILLHAGVIVLLAGEFLTGQMQVETRMIINEKESADFTRSLTEFELAVIDPADPKVDQVVVVPGEMLADSEPGHWINHADIPFELNVTKFFANSNLRDYKPDETPDVDSGIGKRIGVRSRPKVKGTDSDGKLNYPSAIIALRDKGGEALGTYMFSTLLEHRKQDVRVGGKEYQVVLRFQRTYKPYQVYVEKAEHDVYPGTSIAKDFASTLVVKDPQNGDYGPVRIWMNHPMYYRGETFYQSQMNTDEKTGLKTTGLQVVKNPAWTFPYYACVMVALGMGIHFLIRLNTFLKRGGAR